MAFLQSANVLLAKAEATYGTDPTPATGDAVLFWDGSYAFPVACAERKPSSGWMSQWSRTPGQRKAEMKFSTALAWNLNITGAATPAENDALFTACGCTPTITAETAPGANDGKCTVTPNSLPGSATFWLFDHNAAAASAVNKWEINGARGNFTIQMPADGLCEIQWEFKGKYVKPAASTFIAGTYDAQQSVPFVSAAMTWGTWAAGTGLAGLRSVVFSLNNEIGERGDGMDATGYGGVEVTRHAPTVKVVVDRASENAYALWTALEAGTEAALSIGYLGAVNGNMVKITAPKAQIVDIVPGEDNGIVTSEVTLALNHSTAYDDDFAIEFN